MADQHQGLDLERWRRFTRDQQLLMIANEMHRATKALELNEPRSVRLCYERVLRLADLTAAAIPGLSFRREVLRWRELIAESYLSESVTAERHRAALRALLTLSPTAWAQVAFLVPQPTA